MSSVPTPENVRVPQHLSDADLRQALEELDAKIKTLHNRAHATTAGSHATYHEHAAALEAKRAKLVAQLGPTPTGPATGAAPSEQNKSLWEEISRGIDNLRKDLRDIV
ncbi:hypothetical protein MUN82_12515 [Hymenobacter aerilatus]|uniref:Uncharacterized protein n=1 Tax=Hymenobacter aerilatus TaxID=2932251 RepID=A0A8T9SU77_9BACT|nr:hypothetical protein [Hymenobacter aerilatus]UOR03770.1 hypothetical protein MUN82_12515 [Hymenobacter aerilatus]